MPVCILPAWMAEDTLVSGWLQLNCKGEKSVICFERF